MIRLSLLAIGAAALMACNSTETPAPRENATNQTQGERFGRLIKEFPISEETTVRFRETDGTVTLSVEGNPDKPPLDPSLTQSLLQTPTMAAAYRLLDATGPVPQALLDFDARMASAKDEAVSGDAPPANAAVPPAANVPLAKAAGIDQTWNWDADARWWKDVVGYPCQREEMVKTYTNVTWVDDWRQGYYAVGYLMAASHTWGANAMAYIWRNGAWVQTDYMYLQPRHYLVWKSLDKTQQYRRYQVVGFGESVARVHWGMRWDAYINTSGIGSVCIVN